MKLVQKFLSYLNLDTTKEQEVYYFVVVQRWLLCIMALYYIIHMGVCVSCGFQNAFVIAAFFLALVVAGFRFSYHHSDQWMLFYYIALMVAWVGFFIYSYGWGAGGQHFLLLVLLMIFFCVHFNRTQKICWMLGLFVFRIILFIYCQGHEPLLKTGSEAMVVMQIFNSLTLFVSMTIACISFSSNIQASEIKLMNANQSLREQANTDQLTKLPNRRYMISTLNEWIAENPKAQFSVAMSDIDFFKRVNDTWGHECGDEVLKTLAAFFQREMADKGLVCRWGGEEFFFFFPNMNLDQAQYACEMMNIQIRKLVVNYKCQEITFTMTFGVEEADYGDWDLTKIVDKADEKLYLGKQKGRNQVVA